MDEDRFYSGTEPERTADPWYRLVEPQAQQQGCPVIPLPRTSPENLG
ncbi:hypothetical protein [Prauserella endophytica]|nr:hypothetical protein [Prauserella endophytica]